MQPLYIIDILGDERSATRSAEGNQIATMLHVIRSLLTYYFPPENTKRRNYVGPKTRIAKNLRTLLKNVIQDQKSEVRLNMILCAALSQHQAQSWRTSGEFCRGLRGHETN